MIEHISVFSHPYCGIFLFNVSVSRRPYSFSARTTVYGLTQVASLASRHEQITVRAAFFLPDQADSQPDL
jgi:hypothetical protein